MKVIRFPFPNSSLSSNSRKAHRWLTKEREQAREIGFWLTKDARIRFDGKNNLCLHLVICPPDRRHRDDDNIITAFKSYRDGIFKALELDDRLVRRTIIDWGDVEKDGAIYVTLSAMEYLEGRMNG
jgi:crossover junction endodeoxyribonuclease RusA